MKRWIVFAVRILLAAAFAMAGWAKLSGNPMMVQMFGALGLGQWFRYLTGSLEVLGAVGLLPDLTAAPAAILLSCVMLGATLAHLAVLGGNPAPAVVLGLLSAVVAWERLPVFLAKVRG